jgi:2-polyprenyl-3-methyl-5-hydroxy-6-metoxy-1,4-benzoquinol methylase
MTSYVIRGGEAGKARLRVISHALWPTTLNLLNSAGIKPGMACLDVGCGGGDVAMETARLVGPSGRVTGIDMGSAKIQIAQQEAERETVTNVKSLELDIDHLGHATEYDLAYRRLFLTHLRDPVDALHRWTHTDACKWRAEALHRNRSVMRPMSWSTAIEKWRRKSIPSRPRLSS